MKKNNGFTIIEITVSITLILLIALIVVPNLIDMGDSSKERMYDAKIELALNSAYKYGKAHIDDLSNTCTNVTIGKLISDDYLQGDDETGDYINPITNETMNNISICILYEKGEVKVRLQ